MGVVAIQQALASKGTDEKTGIAADIDSRALDRDNSAKGDDGKTVAAAGDNKTAAVTDKEGKTVFITFSGLLASLLWRN